MGLLLGLPLANLPDPLGLLLPLGVSVVLGLGMMGLTVAKRQDLLQAARDAGLVSATRPMRWDGVEAGHPIAPAPTSTPAPSSTAAWWMWSPRVSCTAPWWCRVSCWVSSSTSPTTTSRPPHPRPPRPRVLAVLQKDHRVDLELTDEDAHEVKAVDAKLVALARAREASVLTTDYNLNRVAQLQGVRVMNLNQLANAMKPAFLPGEEMRVKVIQQGKEPGQGVAFLDDGTMIVVEGGGSFLQRELDVTVTRVLQTVAGRMVFAQPIAGSWLQDRPPARRRSRAPVPVAARHHSGMSATSGAFADAVIVAAGSSSRMAGTDKLEATLAGRSLLRWAVESVAAARSVGSVIVVVEPSRVAALAETDWLRALDARAGGWRAPTGHGRASGCAPRPPRWCWCMTAPGPS